MKLTWCSLGAVLAWAIFSLSTPAQESSPAPAPSKSVRIDQKVLMTFLTEPEEHFQKAHDDIETKDLKAAAAEIRSGAEILSREIDRSVPEAKEDLSGSVNGLKALADRVESGGALSDKELDDAFSRAMYFSARHHYLKAQQAPAEETGSKVGYELQGAIIHLKQSATWSGQELDAASLAGIADSRALAGKLITESVGLTAETRKAIEGFGGEIHKLGARIGTAAPASTVNAKPPAAPKKTFSSSSSSTKPKKKRRKSSSSSSGD